MDSHLFIFIAFHFIFCYSAATMRKDEQPRSRKEFSVRIGGYGHMFNGEIVIRTNPNHDSDAIAVIAPETMNVLYGRVAEESDIWPDKNIAEPDIKALVINSYEQGLVEIGERYRVRLSRREGENIIFQIESTLPELHEVIIDRHIDHVAHLQQQSIRQRATRGIAARA